jgi:thiol-disulfide isomerase/thioredoxin
MTLKRAVPALVIGAILLIAAASTDARSGFRFTLRDTAGTVHDEREWANAKAVVLFFITPDCPISQGYVPEINRIAQEYRSRGVRAYAVQSDVTAAPADVRRHVAEYGYRLPVLDDPAQRLVAHTGAEITPEAVVLSPDGRVLYRGRIDDRIVSLGTRRPQATRHDLRNALDAVLSGRAVARAKTTAFGCIISRPS